MIPYTRHETTAADRFAVERVLKSRYLTQGPQVEALEAAFAETCGAKYAVAVNSGTAALHLAYLACGVGPGTTVLTSPVTFVATANAALYCGAEVEFFDQAMHPQICYPSPITVGEGAIPFDPKYITVWVSLGGSLSVHWPKDDTQAHLRILDACHGPYRLEPGWAAACFSLHPAKHVAAGEGGAVVTNDWDVWVRCMHLRNHGRIRDSDTRFDLRMTTLGYNYRLNEMSAALAASQLSRLDANIAKRRAIAAQYDEAFHGHVRTVPHSPESARHLYQLLVDDRDVVRSELAKRGVGSQVHYSPIVPLQPYYLERFGYELGMWPNAEWHAAHTLSIPLFPQMHPNEIAAVIGAVKEVCSG